MAQYKGISLIVTILFMAANCFGQLIAPRESNKEEITQTVGDAKISITYHRPNVKGRAGKIFGCSTDQLLQKGNNTGACLVPNGQVWRAGANENTVIEFSTDVTIKGQPLPAGKYGFFALPSKNQWSLIFSKVNDKWGAFSYDATQDALRVNVTPIKTKTSQETLSYVFESINYNTTNIVLSWERMQIPFEVNVGDINGRFLNQVRDAITKAKADDARPYNSGVSYIISNKLSASYADADNWLAKSISIKETFGNLANKARLLFAMGKRADAIAAGEKAVSFGKALKPAANTSEFEADLANWKTTQ